MTSTESAPAAGTEGDTTPADAPAGSALSDKNIAELAKLASDHYEAAQRALRREDWTTYGQELEQMEAALNALVELTSDQLE